MRIAWLHLRVGVMNEFQYRVNFIVQLIQSLVSLATAVIVLTLIFRQTDELGGWSRPELLTVIGVFTIVGGIVGFVIEPNMGRLISDIRLGTFDYLLTKPVDSQLLVSVREFRLWRLTDVVVGIGVAAWGVSSGGAGFGLAELGGFLVTIVAGCLALYCTWLLLTTSAFWFVRMEQLQELFTGLYRAGQYPVGIYPGWLRVSLSYLVPLGFAITVPAEALTGRLTIARLLITVGFSAAMLLVTRVIWRFGVRHYSGASA